MTTGVHVNALTLTKLGDKYFVPKVEAIYTRGRHDTD